MLFNRKITRKIAGGARAVFDRAALYAEAGLDVSMVFTEFGDDRSNGMEALRAEGILHPAVRVLRFWRDAIPAEAWIAASQRPTLAPPPPPLGPDLRVEVMTLRRQVASRATYQGDTLRDLRLYYAGGAGAIRVWERFDAAGRRVERWRFDLDGAPVTIDTFDPVKDQPLRRAFVALGRAVWLDAAISAYEGSGPAVTPLSPAPPTPSLAGAVAAWLDRLYRDVPEFVCIADGENVSQHVVRALRHPGARAVAVLHNCHTGAPYDAAAPTKPNWERFLSPGPRPLLTVCLTGRQKTDLERRYPHLTIEVAHHAATPARPVRVRRDPHRLVYVGRLSDQKRLDHLISAFAKVATAAPKARLEIWGDGAERGALQAQVAALGLGGRVAFRGFTKRPDLAFASAAATVMTSRYEGFPLTLLEAMSVGTPFVAYDVNYGPGEVIRDGVDGFLTPVGDVDVLAGRLIEVLRDRGLQASLQAAARDVLQRFSSERYRRRWLEILDIACALHETGRPARPALAAAAE